MTPYLAITSPDRQCGKTRLMEVLELLVARPWLIELPSEAVLYRTIHGSVPTLLWDEIDTVFNTRTADKYEAQRAVLNSGNRRGVTVPRCVGSSSKVSDFNVYSAKALAGIGTLPDTVADRSLRSDYSGGSRVRRSRGYGVGKPSRSATRSETD